MKTDFSRFENELVFIPVSEHNHQFSEISQAVE